MTEGNDEANKPTEKDAPQEQSKSKDVSLIAQATRVAERAEKAADRIEAAIEKQQSMQVEGILGGKADVSLEPKEETNKEYKDRVMANDLKK